MDRGKGKHFNHEASGLTVYGVSRYMSNCPTLQLGLKNDQFCLESVQFDLKSAQSGFESVQFGMENVPFVLKSVQFISKCLIRREVPNYRTLSIGSKFSNS